MRSRPDRGNFVGDLDMNISLVLADEQPVCLVGLKTLLEGYPEFEVRASCSDGEQALRAVEEHLPDILVADLRLPVLGTLELLRQIEARKLAVRVVVLAASLDEEELLELMRIKVRGVILKNMLPELFIRCLNKVHAGGEWLEQRATGLALAKLVSREQVQQRLRGQLTAREMELAILAAQGLSNREIGDRLFISIGTVKGHLYKIYDKLQVKNRIGLSHLARQQGWV